MCKKDLKTLLLLLLTFALWAIVYNMLTSCTKTVQKSVVTHDTVYVAHSSVDTFNVQEKSTDTVYVAKTDTFIKTDIKRDSIFVRDSVYVREKGDSVYVYKEKWRTKIDIKHDTIFKSKTDTVYQDRTDTVTVYRYVERNDSAYNSKTDKEKIVKQKRTSGWMKVLGLVIAIAVLAVWRKFRR